jgi:multidrug efflux pump subunit AcrA (membrane-fusion protein)
MFNDLKTLFGASIAVVALSACGPSAAAPAAPPPPQVSVAVPLQEQVSDWDEFTGRFEAVQRVEVRARAGGFIQTAHFAEGETVRKGQALFTLDPRPARAALASAEADAQLARRSFERGEMLMKEQAISREEYETRKASLDVAEAAPGNVISGGTSAADVLTTIVALDPIHFEFEASEAQLLRYQREALKTGGKVQIRLQDEDDYRWSGAVDFSDAVVDAASGAVRMRAKVANPEGFLKPGMFGRARVEGSASYAAMLIPDTAIVSEGPTKSAMVVGGAGKVEAKPLEVGQVIGGLRVVRSGLAPTDQVIVNGVQRAMPGVIVSARATTITRAAALDAPAARQNQ